MKMPTCTHLSNIGILSYQFSLGNADAGSVNKIVDTMTKAIAGRKKRY